MGSRTRLLDASDCVKILGETLQTHLRESAIVVGELRVLKDILEMKSWHGFSSDEEAIACAKAGKLAAVIAADMAVNSTAANLSMKSLLVLLEALANPVGAF